MIVEKIKPEIVTYRLVMESDDEEYTSCMWARFILDYDTWRLTINSDAGDYTYCWGNNDKNDNFTSLMARVNEGYLLNKLSSRSYFKVEESIEETIKNIECDGWDYFGIESEKEWKEIKERLNDISWLISEEMYINEVSGIVPEIDFESIEIIKDYPYQAYIAIRLFIKYIQPLLKEEWNKISKEG